MHIRFQALAQDAFGIAISGTAVEHAAAGGTPRDYGLRVRKHPAGLLITARAKMRNGKELELDYSGAGIPTNAFSLEADDFIGKPFNPEVVVSRLRRLLKR